MSTSQPPAPGRAGRRQRSSVRSASPKPPASRPGASVRAPSPTGYETAQAASASAMRPHSWSSGQEGAPMPATQARNPAVPQGYGSVFPSQQYAGASASAPVRHPTLRGAGLPAPRSQSPVPGPRSASPAWTPAPEFSAMPASVFPGPGPRSASPMRYADFNAPTVPPQAMHPPSQPPFGYQDAPGPRYWDAGPASFAPGPMSHGQSGMAMSSPGPPAPSLQPRFGDPAPQPLSERAMAPQLRSFSPSPSPRDYPGPAMYRPQSPAPSPSRYPDPSAGAGMPPLRSQSPLPSQRAPSPSRRPEWGAGPAAGPSVPPWGPGAPPDPASGLRLQSMHPGMRSASPSLGQPPASASQFPTMHGPPPSEGPRGYAGSIAPAPGSATAPGAQSMHPGMRSMSPRPTGYPDPVPQSTAPAVPGSRPQEQRARSGSVFGGAPGPEGQSMPPPPQFPAEAPPGLPQGMRAPSPFAPLDPTTMVAPAMPPPAPSTFMDPAPSAAALQGPRSASPSGSFRAPAASPDAGRTPPPRPGPAFGSLTPEPGAASMPTPAPAPGSDRYGAPYLRPEGVPAGVVHAESPFRPGPGATQAAAPAPAMQQLQVGAAHAGSPFRPGPGTQAPMQQLSPRGPAPALDPATWQQPAPASPAAHDALLASLPAVEGQGLMADPSPARLPPLHPASRAPPTSGRLTPADAKGVYPVESYSDGGLAMWASPGLDVLPGADGAGDALMTGGSASLLAGRPPLAPPLMGRLGYPVVTITANGIEPLPATQGQTTFGAAGVGAIYSPIPVEGSVGLGSRTNSPVPIRSLSPTLAFGGPSPASVQQPMSPVTLRSASPVPMRSASPPLYSSPSLLPAFPQDLGAPTALMAPPLDLDGARPPVLYSPSPVPTPMTSTVQSWSMSPAVLPMGTALGAGTAVGPLQTSTITLERPYIYTDMGLASTLQAPQSGFTATTAPAVDTPSATSTGMGAPNDNHSEEGSAAPPSPSARSATTNEKLRQQLHRAERRAEDLLHTLMKASEELEQLGAIGESPSSLTAPGLGLIAAAGAKEEAPKELKESMALHRLAQQSVQKQQENLHKQLKNQEASLFRQQRELQQQLQQQEKQQQELERQLGLQMQLQQQQQHLQPSSPVPRWPPDTETTPAVSNTPAMGGAVPPVSQPETITTLTVTDGAQSQYARQAHEDCTESNSEERQPPPIEHAVNAASYVTTRDPSPSRAMDNGLLDTSPEAPYRQRLSSSPTSVGSDTGDARASQPRITPPQYLGQQMAEMRSIQPRPRLGVEIKMLDDNMGNRASVVVVHSVVQGSPADQAGLQAEDIIVNWNGVRVSSKGIFEANVMRSADGEVALLDVVRGNQVMQKQVFIGGRSNNASPQYKGASLTQGHTTSPPWK